ncbi:hypothetical protein RRU94_21200 [Domibacillus sp. DTU_2020_1001157_1_SI_ALB_TIR_016]|uniref:hypothetical protein n=1 Tax=Domibacillus sp. DTU_2020_1001157_1_SI_ALB_TIR_016 TaxID=3077789 RepID=UPI0028E24E4C|nr:hypothetical protein [Domibacillus sp. DTU_2020_1001157_1_SI_ALB_TIR_016]WNS80025.1 hypothetical protein RRU94_21200 [Domibacillus sp. DTU_2020_1001157_1_SI_ALB_TIR_016]
MREFYVMLVISGVGSIAIVASFIYSYKWNKEEDTAYKIPFKNKLVYAFLIFAFGFIFILSLMDLPNVLMNKTEHYEGKCEVWVYGGGRTAESIEVSFGERMISFSTRGYSKVKDGIYYCEVNYYPVTEQGTVLKLYESKGKNPINVD